VQNSSYPIGIKPPTFQLVAQYLNQLRSTHYLTSLLDGVGGKHHASMALLLRITRYGLNLRSKDNIWMKISPELSRMILKKKNRALGTNPVPVPQCALQIIHELKWD
jgi:hypothetical protein